MRRLSATGCGTRTRPACWTALLSVGTGCLLAGDQACATHWMSELVRHFGATFPNSLRLLALASAPPDAYAAEFRQAETSARQTLHTLAALPQDERSRRLRALFGGSIRLDLPAQRGLDHLARDPQLAQAVEVLQAILARPKS